MRKSSLDHSALVSLLALTAALVGCGGSNGVVAANAGNGGAVDASGAAPSTGGASSSSGGATSTGGTAHSGGTTSATGGAPTHHVGACDNLAARGTWENITPPVNFSTGNGPYGINAFATDPQNAGTVYVGTSGLGLWKTTDCGASWVHINTGKNGENIDIGRQWAVLIDPTNSQIIYTNAGYGGCGKTSGLCTDGALKSTNGGVDWEPIWPPADTSAVQGAPGSVNEPRMDPTDPKHLALGFHAQCSGKASVCWGESHDAGASWRVIWGKPEWSGGKSSIWLLGGSNMLVATENIGLWRTSDAGTTFQQVAVDNTVGHSPGQLYISKTAGYYFGGQNGILHSADGVTWSLIANSGQDVGGVIGDGTTLYESTFAVCFDWGTDLQLYYTAPESTGSPWKHMASPGMKQGGWFGYDADHHVLYSSNCSQGFWRVVTQ